MRNLGLGLGFFGDMYLMGSEEREREAFGEEFGLDGLEELDAGLERERERERGGLECSRGPVGLERK